MRLDWGMLCDAATTRDNLAFILGAGIDTLQSAPLVPGQTTVPGQLGQPVQMAVALRFLLARGELGRPHNFEVKTSGVDGAEIGKIAGNFFAPPNPLLEAGWDQPIVVTLAHQMAPLQFGSYSIDIFADGTHIKSLPFRIIPAQVPPGFPGGGAPPG